MNPLIFPKMLTSHGEGWDWLLQHHPSVIKLYFAYVVPMSLIPPAMLLYAWRTYTTLPVHEISVEKAFSLALLFFVTELVMVPVMGRVIQIIARVADARPSYRRAFTLAALLPTPLWLAPHALFVPSLLFNSLVMLIALGASTALIFQGVYRSFNLDDEGHSLLAAGTVLAAGLVAWVTLMVLAFVSWGMVLT